jgi:hypothetical protein
MSHLVRFCVFCLLLVALAPEARSEDISQCFVVREMAKSEDIRYLVDAVSHCSREYDAVYVMVSFLDSDGRDMGDGLWAIYWCRPGRREFHEFAVPRRAQGFKRVVLKRITTDFTEALH